MGVSQEGGPKLPFTTRLMLKYVCARYANRSDAQLSRLLCTETFHRKAMDALYDISDLLSDAKILCIRAAFLDALADLLKNDSQESEGDECATICLEEMPTEIAVQLSAINGCISID